MTGIGKTLIIFGAILIAVGLIFVIAPKVPYIGKLPGDIYIKKEKFAFYFPLATCILLSAVISFVLWLFRSK